MSKINNIINELELYTIGQPKNINVDLTVEQLQSYIKQIKDSTITKKKCEGHLLLGYTYIKYSCCDHIDEYNSEIKYCKYCGKSIKIIWDD